jgi:hypothetical protein
MRLSIASKQRKESDMSIRFLSYTVTLASSDGSKPASLSVLYRYTSDHLDAAVELGEFEGEIDVDALDADEWARIADDARKRWGAGYELSNYEIATTAPGLTPSSAVKLFCDVEHESLPGRKARRMQPIAGFSVPTWRACVRAAWEAEGVDPVWDKPIEEPVAELVEELVAEPGEAPADPEPAADEYEAPK